MWGLHVGETEYGLYGFDNCKPEEVPAIEVDKHNQAR